MKIIQVNIRMAGKKWEEITMNQPNLFQIKLKSVLVKENGTIKKNVKGVNAIEASLFYPK